MPHEPLRVQGMPRVGGQRDRSPLLEQQRLRAQRLNRCHIVAHEQHCTAFLANIYHLAQALSLKLGISDR